MAHDKVCQNKGVIMKAISAVLTGCLFIFAPKVFALDAGDFSKLQGYTIAKITQVDGDFEGCDFDKKIILMNGWTLTCNTFNYSYSYSPAVAILSRDIGTGYAIKAVIGDHVYDMQPIKK